MRKFYSLVLIAAGLLIGTNLWGTKSVSSLEDLKTALLEGGEIQLSAPIDAGTEQLSVANTVILDLNGFSLSGSREGKDVGVISVSIDGSLTINATNGGEIKTTANQANAIMNAGALTINAGSFTGSYETILQTAGTCTINGGNFYSTNDNVAWIKGGNLVINDGEFYGAWCVLQNNANTEIEINGGHFQPNDGDYGFEYDIYAGGEVNINGGTFESAPKKIINGTADIRGGKFPTKDLGIKMDGYAFKDLGNGIFEVVSAIADIDGIAYQSISSAVEALENGNTLNILTDLTEDITLSSNCTLNIGSHNVQSIVIESDAEVTLIGNGSVQGNLTSNGTLNVELDKETTVAGTLSGTIVIYSGTFTNNPSDFLATNSFVLENTQYTVFRTYAQIGTNFFASLKEAVNSITDATETTIQMIADEIVDGFTGNHITILKDKNIILDLNGHVLAGITGDKGNNCIIKIDNGGSLTVMDTKAPEDSRLGTGKITYSRSAGAGTTQNCIFINYGMLIIKSGIYEQHSSGGTAPFIVDNYGDYGANCIIEDGYFLSDVAECFRNCAKSTTSSTNLTINGGYFEGKGIIFDQTSANSLQTISINGGNFTTTSDGRTLIRFWTDNNSQLGGTSVNITGGVANMDAIHFQHNGYSGTSPNDLEKQVKEFEEIYKSLFNITGGTFKSDKYHMTSNILQEKDPVTGQLYYQIAEQTSVQNFILPTILDGAVCRDEESHVLPGGQDEYPNEITVVPLRNETISVDGNWDDVVKLNDKMNDAATIHSEVTVTGNESCYHVTVEGEGAVLTVKDGAVLYTDDGGIQIKNGGKVIVEAGGILRVGARGMESDGRKSIYAYSTNEKSAVISMSPKGLVAKNPEIAVILTSQAYKRGENDYVWQYIGIPTDASAGTAIESGTQYIKKYNASTQDWENVTNGNNMNEPFRCYCVSNNNSAPGTRYAMGGYLHNKENVTISMKGKSGVSNNWNFLANSYMAPINLEKFFQASLGENIQQTIWLYDAKTSSYKSVVSGDYEDPELIEQLADFTSIAPLQGFVMCLMNDATEASFTFDYATCVWGEEKTDARLAPQRSIAKNVSCLKISVDADEYTHDAIKLVEGENYSSEFDNGYDASKFMNDGVNLYAELNNSNLSRVATDNLNGTQLSFKASNAVEYIMTFSNRNNDNFVLVDHLTNAQVAMTDGATYTFVATPNETTENRFEIRKAGGVVTNLAEMKAAHAVKGIYTAAGQYVGKADRWNTLPAGMYIVDGVKMAK